MSNVKKYVLTAVTLGLIAMASGLLIGATNLITADRIEKNNQLKIENGIKEVLKASDDPYIYEMDTGSLDGYKYLDKCYGVLAEKDAPSFLGVAFLTSGSNMYGKVSLIIGFGADQSFKGVSFVTNEQTYASTLVENYIDPLNAGTREIEDVKCGATYGATLVKDMINEAKDALPSFLGYI